MIPFGAMQKQEEKTENWEKLKTLMKGVEKENVNKNKKNYISRI